MLKDGIDKLPAEPLGKCNLCEEQAVYICHIEKSPETPTSQNHFRVQRWFCCCSEFKPKTCGENFCRKHVSEVRIEYRDPSGHVMGTPYACKICMKDKKKFYKEAGWFVCTTLITMLFIMLSIMATCALVPLTIAGVIGPNAGKTR